MDLRKLLYFAAVAEHGSFTKAAEQLHIAQPALSRQIGILEKEFGVSLLLRMGRRVQLTDAGEVLLRHAHEINNGFERAREEMQSIVSSPKGRVILGAPPSLGSVIVPKLFGPIRREAVDVTLKVREGDTSFLERSIMDAEIDIALLGEHLEAPWIEEREVAQEEIALVAHPSLFERAVAEGQEVWNTVPLFLTWQVKVIAVAHLRSAVLQLPDSSFEFDAIHAIKALVLDGRGFALTPIGLFSPEIEAGQISVSHIANARLSRPIIMAYSSARPRSRAMEAVETILLQQIGLLKEEAAFSPPAAAKARAVPFPSLAKKGRGW